MGRGVAKLLAQKGANIVIVARDEKKLRDALEYVKVNRRVHICRAALTKLQVCRQTLYPTLRLLLLRPHLRPIQHRVDTESHRMEQQQSARYRMGYSWRVAAQALPRRRHQDAKRPDGHQLLGRSILGSRYTEGMVRTAHRSKL